MRRVLLPLLAVLGLPRPVLADPSAADKALAETLFDEARKLGAEGKYEEACPKFAESNRRDPGIGTLLYLADCYEKTNKLASAWATFREASQKAKAAGQTDRAKIAGDRATAIEPQIIRLTVVVSKEAQITGLEVLLDGQALPDALWGTPMPVDGGKHVLEARAPGRARWSTEISLTEKGEKRTAPIPVLAATGAAPPPPPATTASTAPPPPPPKDAPPVRDDGTKPDGAKPAAFAPVAALRFGYAMPTGKSGSAGSGDSVALSSLVSSGPGVEVNGGARIGGHVTAFLFYARQFLSASGDVSGSSKSAYRQVFGLGAQVASSHATRGPVGFYGEAGLVVSDQVALSASAPAGEPACASDAKLDGAGIRLGGGANIPVAGMLVVSPLLTADVGRFSSATLSNDSGCGRKSGSYSLASKDVHATLFAGVSIAFPLELR